MKASKIFSKIYTDKIWCPEDQKNNYEFYSGIGSHNVEFVKNYTDNVKLFESSIPGKISLSIEEGGWGYDPIFIPDGESKTYANVSDKDKFSHRAASLKKFSDWFMHTQ